MSAFLEDIKKITEVNKYKVYESITRDLIVEIQKVAEDGRNKIEIPIRNEEQTKVIEDFCKAHGFFYYISGTITITW